MWDHLPLYSACQELSIASDTVDRFVDNSCVGEEIPNIGPRCYVQSAPFVHRNAACGQILWITPARSGHFDMGLLLPRPDRHFYPQPSVLWIKIVENSDTDIDFADLASGYVFRVHSRTSG